MSQTTHVKSLSQKHAEIDHIIEQETIRPIPDTIRLMQLKRQKLRLKEQLSRLATKH